jgi:hypothetical protein
VSLRMLLFLAGGGHAEDRRNQQSQPHQAERRFWWMASFTGCSEFHRSATLAVRWTRRIIGFDIRMHLTIDAPHPEPNRPNF